MPQTALAASPTGTARGGGRGILRGLLVALPLLVGSCAGAGPPLPSAVLPPDAVEGAGDPTRAAIINTAYAFNAPASLAGRPDEAARAVANYEHLVVEIPTGPRWWASRRWLGLNCGADWKTCATRRDRTRGAAAAGGGRALRRRPGVARGRCRGGAACPVAAPFPRRRRGDAGAVGGPAAAAARRVRRRLRRARDEPAGQPGRPAGGGGFFGFGC